MKEILLTLTMVWITSSAFAQELKTTSTVVLYPKPEISELGLEIGGGSFLYIVGRANDFLSVEYKNQLRFIHKSSLNSCISLDLIAMHYYYQLVETPLSKINLVSKEVTLNVLDSSNLGIFTDLRDHRVYRYVKIGTQTWMAENLAYLPAVNSAYKGSAQDIIYYVYGYHGNDVKEAKTRDTYKTYGVLYNLPAAMNGSSRSTWGSNGVQGVCPDGWHLPNEEEWTVLVYYNKYNLTVFETEYDGTSFITDISNGFNALLGGYRTNYNNRPKYFLGLNFNTNFWSSTLSQSAAAYALSLNSEPTGWNESITYDSLLGNFGFYIRCIKD